MKIAAVNGGPRKKCNTSQMLDSFLSGVRESAPDAEIQTIRLYDYLYTGCKSCFACQLTANRDGLGCRVKDSVTELLKDTFHADGIVFASPVYYLNATAQLHSFWERLMYPGHSPKKIPTAVIYTMNMNEKQAEEYVESSFRIIETYLNDCFGFPPERVCSYDTFQYNDRPNLNPHFRRKVPEKKLRHDEQFPLDLRNAFEAGGRLASEVRKLM